MTPKDIEKQYGGVERISNYDPRVRYKKLDVNVNLRPMEPVVFARGFPPYFPRGNARVESVRSAFIPTGNVIIKVKDLQPSWIGNTYYQAWLYDKESGYTLNLGIFEALSGGVGILQYRAAHYFDHYDEVWISQEPAYDLDPTPNKIVLRGIISQNNYHEPDPAGRKAQYGYLTEY
jgi:hypothetical protein